MIILIQLLVSLALTIWYAFTISFESIILEILSIFFVFIGINLGLMVIILTVFVILILTTEKIDSKNIKKYKFFHPFSVYLFNHLLGVKLKVIGKENLPKDNNFLLVTNHVEFVDPLYLKQVYKDYPLSFVAKDDLFKIFLVKNALRSFGCIEISRKENDRQALQAVLEAIKRIKDGQPIGIFPEGTRNHGNKLNDFKSGSFKIAQKAKADISIAVLYNMHKSVEIFKFLRVKVYIKVLPVLKYEDYKDMDTFALSTYVRDKISEEITLLQESNL